MSNNNEFYGFEILKNEYNKVSDFDNLDKLMENTDKMSKKDRLNMLKKMYQSRTDFENKGRIYIFGFGAIGPVVLYMILKMFKIKQSQITVIDLKVKDELYTNVSYIVTSALGKGTSIDIDIRADTRITEYNYKDLLTKIYKLTKDDIIIDCAIEISSIAIMELCQQYGCGYVNSATELWDYRSISDPKAYTLRPIIEEMKEFTEKLKKSGKINFNAVIDMGCNPGNVSMWVQLGVDLINKHYGNEKPKSPEELGIRTIHISEYDTQRASIPKRQNEYCNTWASTGEPYYEEALAPVEMSFGTHEDDIKDKYVVAKEDCYRAFDRLCLETSAHSYTPGFKNYIGLLIRHGENVTIGEKLSTYKNGKRVWSPSVYYVYHPSTDTMASTYELKEKNFKYQDNTRLFTEEVIDGRDELGLTLFLENGDIFWIGSMMDIDEGREVFENKCNKKVNATVVQVAGGYLSGILHVLNMNHQKKYEGVMVPEELPYKKFFALMKPFYGEFIFQKVENWDYNMGRNSLTFNDYKNKIINTKPEWKLQDFLIDPSIFGLSVDIKPSPEKDKEPNPQYLHSKQNGVFQHGSGMYGGGYKETDLYTLDSFTKRNMDSMIKYDI